MKRGMSPMRDLPLVGWLVAAVAVALAHRSIPESTWLLVHLIALGAMTHAVLVWSAHFAAALLRTRADDRARRRATWRLSLLGLGACLVLVGVPATVWWLVLAGGTLVSGVVVWHGVELARDLRRALPGRFRITIRYYLAAAACLPVGVAFGIALARGLDDQWHANLLVAHTMTNLLGFIGLTVVGTLVTFWPTVLRTRIDERAERLAGQALPVLIGGLAVVLAGALWWRPAAAVGLVVYLAGLVWWGRSLLVPARRQPPREFAAASVGAACVWGGIALIATALHVARADDQTLTTGYPMLASIWVVGFLLQLVTGALSFLLPSVLGGGPTVVRASAAWFDRYATARLVIINGGLGLWLLDLPGWVRVSVSGLVLVALAGFLPLVAGGVVASIRARRGEAKLRTGPALRPRALTGRGAVAGAVALVLAVVLGIAVDPAAVGLRASDRPPEAVTETGRTVRVDVVAEGMRFIPDHVTLARGDRLVITLTNHDPATVHDLQLGDQRTGRLRAGETAELDLGVVSGSAEGWCTVVGHRQLGMVFRVLVDGEAPQSTPTPATTNGNHDHPSQATASPPLTAVVDPVAPPSPLGRLHRLTFTVTEVPLEVGPGVWQQRWTFNGQGVGPTLRGRVGDTFEITLVNDGTIGHSIDFHAGALAPDAPMRTIAPGESLVYRFTATRAGIWMYHCATMPMSAHIAAGMHGAVIIEPEAGLPAVDREYVVVQSEVYLGGASTSAATAQEVNADAVQAEQPDLVVFNGIAHQYDQQPFVARVGERVRFWVLDAGPNRAMSFHIVGAQFDTTYLEGAYLLRNGRDAFGGSGAGAQTLGLLPAQGGFVELTFPEAGRYPVVSHVMVDAERGAHGVVLVS